MHTMRRPPSRRTTSIGKTWPRKVSRNGTYRTATKNVLQADRLPIGAAALGPHSDFGSSRLRLARVTPETARLQMASMKPSRAAPRRGLSATSLRMATNGILAVSTWSISAFYKLARMTPKRTVAKGSKWPAPAAREPVVGCSDADHCNCELVAEGVRGLQNCRPESALDGMIRCGESTHGVHALCRGLATGRSRFIWLYSQRWARSRRDQSRRANVSNGSTNTAPCAHQSAVARQRLSATGSSTRPSSPRCLRSACHLRWGNRRPNTNRGD